MKRVSGGFTLIELMIVVVVVAILAAIAFPSYARYVEQARRADGKAALLEAAQRLERHYTQNNTYVGAPVNDESPDGYYSITVIINATTDPDLPPPNFTLTATPEGVQANSPCGNYWINSQGARDVTGPLGRDRCW